jgi:hypothetical protein
LDGISDSYMGEVSTKHVGNEPRQRDLLVDTERKRHPLKADYCSARRADADVVTGEVFKP